jgi:hypothetical protein
VLVALAALTLAACGQSNRTATLNQTTRVSGAEADTLLQQQLARQGFPGATVSCAKSIIVNVGTTTSCNLSGAGAHRKVRFTFTDLSGYIDPASVKAS